MNVSSLVLGLRRTLLGFVTLALIAGTAQATSISFGPNDIATLFYIAKSNNRDRVDYGIRLDPHCRPAQAQAVFPYWRELEKNPVNVHTLGTFANMAYGVAAQRLERKTDQYADVQLVLKQIDRPIWVTTTTGENGQCKALVRTKIKGVQFAELESIYVKLAGPFSSVDYVEVKGRSPTTGEKLVERLKN